MVSFGLLGEKNVDRINRIANLQDADGARVHRECEAEFRREADEHRDLQEGGEHKGDHLQAGCREEAEDLRRGRARQPGWAHHSQRHNRQAGVRAAWLLWGLLQWRFPSTSEQQGLEIWNETLTMPAKFLLICIMKATEDKIPIIIDENCTRLHQFMN